MRTVIARPITVTRTFQVAPQAVAVQAQPLTVASTASAASSNEDDEISGPPRPYSFAYDTEHDDGSTSRREESSDGNTVRGSYSYRDTDGLFRTVEYIADQNGYRATVKTNEPGTARQDPNPADVNLDVEPVPEAVLRKYSASNLSARSQQQSAAPAAVVAAPVAPAPQLTLIRTQVQAPRVQPIAIALQPQRSPVQTFRLQNAAQPQQSGLRLVPVTGILGGVGAQQAASSNLIFFNSLRR